MSIKHKTAKKDSSLKNDSIVILFKGGRLPSWHLLSDRERKIYSQKHVNLMLSVSQKYSLLHMEGFVLLSPQIHWERFWTIEFPSLEGAEAWIKAEMEPPYGRYGFYEYYLSRRNPTKTFNNFVVQPEGLLSTESTSGPHQIPHLKADYNSTLILNFRRWVPGADKISSKLRGDKRRQLLLQSIAQQHNLIRLEKFQLIAPQSNFHEVNLVEFPTIEAATLWMEAETNQPHGQFRLQVMHLAHRWAPQYFQNWVPKNL